MSPSLSVQPHFRESSRTISDPEIVALLDLLQGDLAGARRWWLAGDLATATAAAEAQIRSGLAGHDVERGAAASVLASAQALLSDGLSLLGQPPVPLGEMLDLDAWFTTDRTANEHLGHFRWATCLAQAWVHTGDERYAERWCQLVDDFIHQAPWAGDRSGSRPVTYFHARPMIDNGGRACDNGEPDWDSPSHWMSLSTAARTHAWLTGLSLVASSRSLTSSRLWSILRSLAWDHYQVLIGNPRHNTPNQVIETSSALLRLGIALPVLRNAAVAFELGHRRLLDALRTQVHPDGSDLERSPNYNRSLPPTIAEILDLLGERGASWGEPLVAYVRRRLRFLPHLATPDLGMVDLRKSHHVDNLRPYLLRWSRQFDEPESLWIATAGQEGRRPPFDSVHIPYGAFTVLRSGYANDAEYALLSVPESGAGHSSDDVLTLMVAAGGDRLIVDSGNYSYGGQTELDRAMAAYCHGSASHSVVLVDGHSQARVMARKRSSEALSRAPVLTADQARPSPARAQLGHSIAYTEGSYEDGFGPEAAVHVRHHRRLFWIQGQGWLVVDHLLPFDADEHRYSTLWMLAAELASSAALDPASGDVRALTPQGATLVVQVMTPTAATRSLVCGADDPVRGWYCVDYGKRVPKPDLAVDWSGAGPQACATWIAVGNGAQLQSAHMVLDAQGVASVELVFTDAARIEVRAAPPGQRMRHPGGEAECWTAWKPAAGALGEEVVLAATGGDHVHLRRCLGADWEVWLPMPRLDTAEPAASP